MASTVRHLHIKFETTTAKSLYQAHVAKWQHCEVCPLYKTRTNTVFFKGTLPAPILFIGEGPGESEDVLGTPFVGPAGLLLDELIQEAGITLPFGVTNIVACRPITPSESNSAGENRAPNKTEAAACSSRLSEMIQLAAPKLIVTLGDIARKYLPKPQPPAIRIANLMHPAAILRRNPSAQAVDCKRFVLQLLQHTEYLR